MSLFETTDADRARWAVHQSIARLAIERYGAEWVERPALGEGFPAEREPSPLAALKACAFTEKIAHQRAEHYVREARGDGASWEVIAEHLGIKEDRFASAAGMAYERFSWASAAHWTCRTCGQAVQDHGPENGPLEEEGHAAGCVRHAADVAAQRATWDDE